MAKFEIGKDFDAIGSPIILPRDWYQLKIVKEPMKKGNAKKTGDNIVLPMRVVADDPDWNGLEFTRYLSLPAPGDDEKVGRNNQTTEDWKLDNLIAHSAAFFGMTVEAYKEGGGSAVEFNVGDEAFFWVDEIQDEVTGLATGNELAFNVAPRALT